MPLQHKKTTPTPRKLRAVIYARVSTKEQGEEGYSIEAQLGLLRGYCLGKGIDVVEEVVEMATASKTGRTEFQRVLKLAASKSIDAIVVEKTDRIYRHKKDAVSVEETGVQVHLVKENTIISKDSRSHDTLIHDIKIAMASNYSKNLSDEAKKGMDQKARSGIWPSHAPIGYRNTVSQGRRIIELDLEMGPKLKQFFETYSTGNFSIREMAIEAKRIGIVSHKGKALSPSMVLFVLNNPIYYGMIRWNDLLHPGIHEPIISLTTWNKVQRVLGKRGSDSASVTKQNYPFKGLVRCSCGCLMSPYTAKGKYVYYACSGYRGLCSRAGIRQEVIIDAVAKEFESLAIKPEFLEPIREALVTSFAEVQQQHVQTLEFLQARYKQCESKLETLYLDKLAGNVPPSIYEKLRVEFTADFQDATECLSNAQRAKHRSWQEVAGLIDLLSNLSSRFKTAETDLQRELFKNALSNCVIKEGTVQIELRSWFKVVREANSADARTNDVFKVAAAVGLEPTTR